MSCRIETLHRLKTCRSYGARHCTTRSSINIALLAELKPDRNRTVTSFGCAANNTKYS